MFKVYNLNSKEKSHITINISIIKISPFFINANSALIFVILKELLDTNWIIFTVKQTCGVSVCTSYIIHSNAVPGTVRSPPSSEATLRVILQCEHPLTVTCVGGGGGGGGGGR